MLDEKSYKFIKDAWQLMDKYKQYPIGNRGMAAFFANELVEHINEFRKSGIKEASISELVQNMERVFAGLKISSEYFSPDNKQYLLASIATLLSCLTCYTYSKNKLRGMEQVIKEAEAFALWGTGRCNNMTCMMFLLLGHSTIRPIEFVQLEASDKKSAHCLLLIGRRDEISLENFYDDAVIVVDYWSGCIGRANNLFNGGPLTSFKNRKVQRCATLNKTTLPLPEFIFPEQEHINQARQITEIFCDVFLECITKKIQNSKISESFFIKNKYQKRTLKTDFIERGSFYCDAHDEYDIARENNIIKFGF
ncbi:hypothetical protein [Legionella fairfieldensis]|uniref:hypothetical protein n=1 Tax=Legionella fairfieldensis TaxID=45064 RepID=UPI00048A575C|nr:hypothetical protein [Legionella fairfieldensis]